MKMNKKGLIVALVVMMSLCGCTSKDAISINVDSKSGMYLLENNLTPESYKNVVEALEEKQRRSKYIDLEDVYQKLKFDYNKEFSDAYNYTLIDAKGTKLREAKDVDIDKLDKFVTEKYATWEDLETYLRNTFTDKDALLQWVETQRWYMDRPEYEPQHKHADIMYIDYLVDGAETHLEDDVIDTLTYDGLMKWLSIAFEEDLQQYTSYKNGKLYRLNTIANEHNLIDSSKFEGKPLNLSEEELEDLYLNYLGTVDFQNTTTSEEISLVDGRHVLTEGTVALLLKREGVENSKVGLKAFNRDFIVDCSELDKQALECENLKALQNPISVEYIGVDVVMLEDTASAQMQADGVDNPETAVTSAEESTDTLAEEPKILNNIEETKAIGPGMELTEASEEGSKSDTEAQEEKPVESNLVKEALPKYRVTYTIDGKNRGMIVTTDASTKKLNVSKYDIYKFLDMQIY